MIAAPATGPALGTILKDTYELIDVLGQGGMGRVYRAIQHPLGRTVAVKVLIPQDLSRYEEASIRFLREAKATARLTHPNTVTVYDFGITPEGWTFIAMEYLEGRTLRAVLERRGTVDPVWFVGILEQVAGSVAEAHAFGIVHRDLKPANVFLAQVGGRRDVVKVLDFGLAKAFAPEITLQDITAEDVVVGTAGYLAPEQIRCLPLDQRVDVWALGTLAYQALTGRLPFTGTKAEVVHRTLERSPPPPSQIRPELPEAIDRVILWALEKAPGDRPDSVTELARACALAVGAPFSLEEAHVGTVPAQPAIVIRPPPPADDATRPELPDKDDATVQAIPSARSLPRMAARAATGDDGPSGPYVATAQSLPKPPSEAIIPVSEARPGPSAVRQPAPPKPEAQSNRRVVVLVLATAAASAAAAALVAWLASRVF